MATPLLRGMRRQPAQQGQLPHPVPDPLWRRGDRQPSAASMPMPSRGTGHHVAIAETAPRTRRPRAAVFGGALGGVGQGSARIARGRPMEGSLVPYAAVADLLPDVLPSASGTNATTVRQHVLHVAERAEGELGDERPCFIDGCPAEWPNCPSRRRRPADLKYRRGAAESSEDLDACHAADMTKIAFLGYHSMASKGSSSIMRMHRSVKTVSGLTILVISQFTFRSNLSATMAEPTLRSSEAPRNLQLYQDQL